MGSIEPGWGARADHRVADTMAKRGRLRPAVHALAVLSMHTSPLAQPGTGDGGGMNVYIRELASALARSGVRCEVFTRAERSGLPSLQQVEPGFRVHHVKAGPVAPVAKERLPALVGEWTEGVAATLSELSDIGGGVNAIHANYWLSGLAGHELKHRLDLPLISTFHTLDRVKAQASAEELTAKEPALRSAAEAAVVGCSDVVLASCSVEAEQLVELYDADRTRIEVVAPGVDHAFFGPGDRTQARRAAGRVLDGAAALHDPAAPMLLFVGRIQPLKGLGVAVRALGELRRRGPKLSRTELVVIGGPSGPQGEREREAVGALVAELALQDNVHFLPPQRHEMLSTFYRAADACVVPSRSESFGLVALEAAACGIPVVASAVGGLTTLVDHGHSGFLIDSRSPTEYADALSLLLTDERLAAAMRRAAVRRAGEYTWATAASRLSRRVAALASRTLVACE